MSKWQPKTRGGYPVENIRPIDSGIWRWKGRVTHQDGSKGTLTWTEDGYHMSHKRPSDIDLIPLEAPAEPVEDPPLDPAKAQAHNRLVLALAATQYKRACDVTEAAEAAEQLAHDALVVAFESYGDPTVVVNIDGAAILFEHDGGVGYAEIEVL